MKKFLRFFIFIMAFQVEVRVRAAGDLMQEPEACLKSKEVCSIRSVDAPFHLQQEPLSLHATQGATVVRLTPQLWRLVKGSLWMEKAPGVEVETPYANISGKHGQYWVLNQGDKVVIRNITAEVTVILRDGKKLNLPEGFEFWISGINSNGKNEYGMIQPIPMKEHLTLWGSLYQGSKEDFVKQVTHLKENWGDMADKSAHIYQAGIERRIASIAEEKEKIAEHQRKQQAEHDQIRKIYLQRTFER